MKSETIARRKTRLHHELSACFDVLDSSLQSYYAGDTHMYRPMSAQLRILFCDTYGGMDNSLIGYVFPTFRLSRVQPIEWVLPESLPSRNDDLRYLSSQAPSGQDIRIAKMPFVIREYAPGLQVADMEMAESGPLLSMPEWVAQEVTIYPQLLSIRSIIRSVADKGGGAHVDRTPGRDLSLMRLHGPAGLGVHVLFIVALARLAQVVGVHYAQFRKQCGYKGSLDEVTFDPEDETAKNMAKVPEEFQLSGASEYHVTVVKRFA
jgi:hypothetical protein